MSQPAQVLLIEDNPGDADLVRLRLVEGKTPVNVSCFSRLSDGLASLATQPPTVVLLDLNLPDSRGPETFRKVLEKAPDVPVVILSGQEDETLAMKAIHQGVQDYLVKGDMTSRNLERSMRYAIERQALMRSLEISRKQQIEFKNQFLSHVSHELRTPLTCIHQYVSLLFDGLAGPVTPEQRDHLQTVLKSVNQLHAMIRDLLEATRAESGKLRVEPRCLALVELVQQAVAMVRPSAEQKRISVELVADASLPLTYADPDRVLEVLINLLDNAIKFTDSGGAISLKANALETDSDFIYVSVSDNGPGISPEAMPLIFERLYQEPDSIEGIRSGLGLGLYIARELITLHGGRIWVASQPGEGSTFTFTLPVYYLPKLLKPVIVHEGKLRDAFVLLRVDLRPLSNLPRGNWRETCRQSLELLQRCVYVDKDLVLPAIAGNGPIETFFVVASTDMQRVEIMISRVKEQLGAIASLKSSGTVEAIARPVPVALSPGIWSVDEQVEAVAETVRQMIVQELAGAQSKTEKENRNAN
jgi:signal transduction histidine kinase